MLSITVEEETMTCLMARGVEDPEAIAAICQSEANASMAWGKSGGKAGGKGKRPGFAKPYKSRLSLEDRKKSLAKLKKETKCDDCGEVGHWKGDKECKRPKAGKKKRFGMMKNPNMGGLSP